VDDACELALECLDALGDDLIRVKTTDCFDIVKEARWNCIIVEGFIGIGRPAVEIDAVFVLGPRDCMLEVS
jgi:hypothetical protein